MSSSRVRDCSPLGIVPVVPFQPYPRVRGCSRRHKPSVPIVGSSSRVRGRPSVRRALERVTDVTPAHPLVARHHGGMRHSPVSDLDGSRM